jgi:hypothetical protein
VADTKETMMQGGPEGSYMRLHGAMAPFGVQATGIVFRFVDASTRIPGVDKFESSFRVMFTRPDVQVVFFLIVACFSPV